MNEILASVSLTTITCACGGTYAISEAFRKEAYELGGFKKCWHCPYCDTSRGYGKGTVQKLEAELAEQKRFKEMAMQRERSALAEAEHFRKSRDGMKGALIKTQVRVKGGVCPCCNRTFIALQQHMKSKHPGFACEKVVTHTS